MLKSILGAFIIFILNSQQTFAEEFNAANLNSPPTQSPSRKKTNTSKMKNDASTEEVIEDVAETEVEAERESKTSSNREVTLDLPSKVFSLDPSLNISLGVEVTNGETYLIIEMDHNPLRNGFIFRFDLLYPGLKTDTVALKNEFFGFKNRPVAQLPLIEVESENARFITNSSKHRTHQRVNLSKVLRELEDIGRLMTADEQKYSPNDIKEYLLLVKKPSSKNGKDFSLSTLQINPSTLEIDKIHQIYGSETLTDLKELNSYKVGDVISVPQDHKMPYRSHSTQWVLLPKKSTSSKSVYKLISNPQVGDQYKVSTSFENLEKALPKAKAGFLWVKVNEENGVSTFSLARENAKLSPNVLMKYLKHFSKNVALESQNGVDIEAHLPELLKKYIPIDFIEERLPALADTFINAKHPTEMLVALMQEQEMSPSVDLKRPAGKCEGFLGN